MILMAKKIQMVTTVEEINGVEIKATKNQYKKDATNVQEAPVVEIKMVTAEEIMTEDFMKQIHSNYNGALPKSVKEFVEEQKLENIKNQEKMEFVMLTQESRKIYYLLQIGGSEPLFIGSYKSIMECKIFTMKLAALVGDEIKIHYFKPGRKNQSSEKISGKTYFDKIEKYQSI
jgi:hypothetical protein